MNELSFYLEQFGFAHEEASVYLHLQQNGSLSAQQLSSDLSLTSLSCHAALNALIEKGVISSFVQNETIYYTAEPAQTILHRIEKEQEEREKQAEYLREKLLEVESMKEEKIASVRFFEGKEGLLSMLQDFFESGASEAYEFFPQDPVEEVFTEEERSMIGRKRRQNNISMTCLFTEKDSLDKPRLQSDESRKSIRIDGQKYPLNADVIIYNDKVAMASLEKNLSGVIVQSGSIANSLRSIFKLAYKSAENDKKGWS